MNYLLVVDDEELMRNIGDHAPEHFGYKVVPTLLIKVIFYLCIIFCLSACSSTPFKGYPKRIGYSESGKASFYAMKYHNRVSASGEHLDQYSLTAAHRTLPFGTKVKVTNLKNGKSVIVIINDRGPFVKGRVIDLTQSAFKKIGNLKTGTIMVIIEVIE